MPTDIQLIVTDLDGTLWDRPDSVHPRVTEAIARIGSSGPPLLVATGRRVASTRESLAALGLAPPAVVLNGALGLDLRSGRRFHCCGFSPVDAAAVLAAFVSCEVEPCVYVDHDGASVRIGNSPSTHPDHLASFGEDVVAAELDGVVATEQVLAFGVLGISEDRAARLAEALAPIASPHLARDRQYGAFSVTVAPAAQSKWNGVAAYCDRVSIDEGAVLAIGDGPNDVELLERAAVAVAPADAHPAARAHADRIVGRAADGGWAELLAVLGFDS